MVLPQPSCRYQYAVPNLPKGLAKIAGTNFDKFSSSAVFRAHGERGRILVLLELPGYCRASHHLISGGSVVPLSFYLADHFFFLDKALLLRYEFHHH